MNRIKRFIAKQRLKNSKRLKSNKSNKKNAKTLKKENLYIFKRIFKWQLFFVFFVLIIIIAGVPYLQAYLDFQPQTFQGNSEVVKNWNGKDRLIASVIGLDQTSTKHNFVDAIFILIIDPTENEVGIFSLSPDILLNSTNNGFKAQTSIRTALNQQDFDIRELNNSLEDLLAVKIDRYLISTNNKFYEFSKFLTPVILELSSEINDTDVKVNNSYAKWQKGTNVIYPNEFLAFLAVDEGGIENQLNRQVELYKSIIIELDSLKTIFNLPKLAESFSENFYTNFSKNELQNLFFTIWGLRSDQIKIGYSRLQSLNITSSSNIYPLYEPIRASLDKDLSSVLYNFKIAKEQARVELYNASGKSGVANTKARWLTNSGTRVVRVGNYSKNIDSTIVYVKEPEKYQNTLNEIKRVFGGNVLISQSEFEDKHIGDIIVLIGKNFL